nr:hypothetical protein [Tanacetum cinerariifolium]
MRGVVGEWRSGLESRGGGAVKAKPAEKYLNAVKRIFRRLKGTINMGLWYLKNTGNGYDKKGQNSEKTEHKTESVEKSTVRSQQKVKPDKVEAKETKKSKKTKEEGPKLPFSKVVYKEEPRWENDPGKLGAAPDSVRELLRAPTEGYVEAIVAPPILADQFELKHSLINMMTTDQFFGLKKDNPHDHIRWSNKITSTIKYKDVPNSAIKLMLFPFSLAGAAPFVKAVEEICVTCGGAHPYYQCLAAGGNTFPELQDNIQGYVSAVAVNYNHGNSVYHPPGSGSLPSNTVANPKGELKAITTRSSHVLDGPTIPTPLTIINSEVDERVEETLTDPDLAEYTIKVPPPPDVQKKQQEKDEVQIHKFWKMFKQLHINITLDDALILKPKYQKMLKALMSNKEKLQELANTTLNENCSAVILKKLLEKLGDPGKFLIPCGFSELKCKALADLGASINLMPLSVWKKLGLPELISTRITFKLANRAICTPAGIARDVFVSVGKFTFPADFVVVDYESDPRVPLILGRPFLRTARALIDVYGEEMILRDGDERLTLNMRHDTSSYSNQPQRESINFINVFNNLSKGFLEDLFSNQPSGNPTFSSHPGLTSPEVKNDNLDLEGGNVLLEKLIDLDSSKYLHPSLHVNPLSGSTTYSFSSSLLLEELVDELALITFPSEYDDHLQFDVDNLANLADNVVDSMPEMFTDEHDLDYSSPSIFDEYDDDFLEVESDTENVYDDHFDSRGEKIKEFKLLIDELDPPCDFLPFEYDSFISQDFSRVDAKPSTNNEDKRRNRKRSKQPLTLEESPVDTMTDQRTMTELLRAPTEGYAEAIVVPPILAEQFELKHSLITMMTTDQFFRLEKDNPHDHIRCPPVARKKPPRSIHTWQDLVSKFINEFFPPSRITNLRNEILNFQQRFDESFYEAWDRYKDLLRACPHYGGNLLERRTQDVLMIIENKSKVRNSRSKLVVSKVKACDVNSNSFSEIAKLTHAVNQQTSVVTTSMTAMLKQFQATPPLASFKVVEETCVTCGDAHPYYQCLVVGGNTFPELKDNIQGYVSAAAVNYNQGNPGYRPPGMANQIRPPGFAQPNVQNNQNRFGPPQGFNCGSNFNHEQSYQAPAQQNQNVYLNELEKVKRINEANMKAMQTQIDKVKNELRNEMKNSIQTSLSNQTNEIKNMMASLLQINTASTSGTGSLPSNTVANPNGELKAITTRSGLVIDGPTVPTPPQSIYLEVDERVEETFTDPNLAEYTIKVPPPHKMLKVLLSNKEKLLELASTPLNENFSAGILKKLPKKLGDPGKFLIPCGFSELKCKTLADLGASINLMPLYVWKKLGLPKLISTRMTLELANRALCTPAGIARDVFVLVGKFTFPGDFIIVDYESDPRVPLILGRPFLRTARALIDVHGEEMILRDGDERLILNMIHDTSRYSNQPQKESINLINVFDNSSEDFLKDLFSNQPSGNPTFSFHPELTSPKVKHDIFDLEGCNFDIESDLKEIEFLLYQDKDSSLMDSIDQKNLANLADIFVDSTPEMFIDEHALNYSSPPIFDEYDDDFLEVESDDENVYDDPFDSKGEKIK